MKIPDSKLLQRLNEYIDVRFTLTLILLTTGFYYFNLFFIAITDSQGAIYSSFLANHLDYIFWVKMSILNGAHQITELLGHPSHLAPDFTLVGSNRGHVTVAFACVGFGVTGFWWAFIIAQTAGWRKKLYWAIGGAVALWFINCWRVALLLIAYDGRWQVNRFAEHHTLFNIAAYLLIGLMIYLYYRSSKEQPGTPALKTNRQPSIAASGLA